MRTSSCVHIKKKKHTCCTNPTENLLLAEVMTLKSCSKCYCTVSSWCDFTNFHLVRFQTFYSFWKKKNKNKDWRQYTGTIQKLYNILHSAKKQRQNIELSRTAVQGLGTVCSPKDMNSDSRNYYWYLHEITNYLQIWILLII